jgi:hypothetical protein
MLKIEKKLAKFLKIEERYKEMSIVALEATVIEIILGFVIVLILKWNQ